MDFNPSAQSPTSVAWLRRVQIGTFRAFAETFLQILWSPTHFAKLICAGTRVSQTAARKFRWYAIGIATLNAVATTLCVLCWNTSPSVYSIAFPSYLEIAVLVGMIWAVFISFITVMPVVPTHPDQCVLARLECLQAYSTAPLLLLPLADLCFSINFYGAVLFLLAEAALIVFCMAIHLVFIQVATKQTPIKMVGTSVALMLLWAFSFIATVLVTSIITLGFKLSL